MPNCYSLNIKEHLKLILTLYTFFFNNNKNILQFHEYVNTIMYKLNI